MFGNVEQQAPNKAISEDAKMLSCASHFATAELQGYNFKENL